MEPRFPDVTVQLSDRDGNVFAVIGRVRTALRGAGYDLAVDEFTASAVNCDSYDAVLQLCFAWVNVE